jgi:hypothetical protein
MDCKKTSINSRYLHDPTTLNSSRIKIPQRFAGEVLLLIFLFLIQAREQPEMLTNVGFDNIVAVFDFAVKRVGA